MLRQPADVVEFFRLYFGPPQRAFAALDAGAQAALGVFITLENPSRDMNREAAASGLYHSPGWERDYPRLQILTIADLFNGATVQMPPASTTFKPAEKVKESGPKQRGLFEG